MKQTIDTHSGNNTKARATVTDFPGNPAAPLPADPTIAYGLQPGTTALFAEMADTLQATVSKCPGNASAAAAKAAMRAYICEPELINLIHKESNVGSYRRHLLYAAPDATLSIIAVVWMPGQISPVHGHTAWGAVGVYEGAPFCESFDTWQNENDAMNLRSKMKLRLKAGDLSTVRPGVDDLHRIGNDTHRRCITIHAYGRDLLASPGSININFNS